MTDALLWHRIQFAFTITFHYLFPQLTMGLALLIVVFKSLALRLRDESYNEVARFWGRIFALNFAMGVVTGIPMEFQFGTNWSRFSRFSGEVVGQALAMEGVFAFFLESTFLGLFLFGEKRLGPRGHLAAAVALALGSWLSGYFIIVANAFMQHPVGYRLGEDGVLHLESFRAYVFNPWALWQYAHNMLASLVTASFVVAAVGAYWSLMGQHARHAGICLRVGVISGLVSSLLVAFPTGDGAGKMVARHQPVTLAAMEGLFEGGPYAELAIIGQPDVAARKLENPIVVPWILSFLCYGSFGSTVHGLNDFPTGPVAAERGAPLLQLPHHGRARDALHPDDGDRVVAPAAGTAGDNAPDALGADAGVPVPLHRDDRRLVDRRAGTPAVGRPRPDAHGRRPLETRQPGRCCLHLAGLRRPLLAPRHALRRPGPQGNQPRPGRVALGHSPWKPSGSRSSRPCSPSTRCSTASTSGSAILHRLVARTDEERRTVLAAIGPVWDGNEVWLIAAGGVLFMAFPRVYATAFSGFYMALMIVLWLLILRGVAIEFRSHQDHPLWREFWDTVFSLASALLAVVFGTTLGNLDPRRPARERTGSRGMPLFTNFRPGREPGILDWYTGLVGLFTLVALAGPRRPVPRVEDDRARAGAQPGLRPTGVEGRARPVGRRHRRHRLGAARGLLRSRRPSLGPRLRRASRSPGPGGRSGSRGAAVSSRRSSPRPRSCSGWWPRHWRAITRSGCGRPSTPPTASPPSNAASDRYGLGVALAWWAVGIALVAVLLHLSVSLDAGEGGCETGSVLRRSTLCFLRRRLAGSRRKMTRARGSSLSESSRRAIRDISGDGNDLRDGDGHDRTGPVLDGDGIIDDFDGDADRTDRRPYPGIVAMCDRSTRGDEVLDFPEGRRSLRSRNSGACSVGAIGPSPP